MKWRLCVSDGRAGYNLNAWTEGDNYHFGPHADSYGWIEAKMDDGTPVLVNKRYVVLMYPDDEEGEA